MNRIRSYKDGTSLFLLSTADLRQILGVPFLARYSVRIVCANGCFVIGHCSDPFFFADLEKRLRMNGLKNALGVQSVGEGSCYIPMTFYAAPDFLNPLTLLPPWGATDTSEKMTTAELAVRKIFGLDPLTDPL